jgi:hypothetical protein
MLKVNIEELLMLRLKEHAKQLGGVSVGRVIEIAVELFCQGIDSGEIGISGPEDWPPSHQQPMGNGNGPARDLVAEPTTLNPSPAVIGFPVLTHTSEVVTRRGEGRRKVLELSFREREIEELRALAQCRGLHLKYLLRDMIERGRRAMESQFGTAADRLRSIPVGRRRLIGEQFMRVSHGAHEIKCPEKN